MLNVFMGTISKSTIAYTPNYHFEIVKFLAPNSIVHC